MFVFIFWLVCGKVFTIGDETWMDIYSSSTTPVLYSYPSCFTEGTTWSTEEALDILPKIPSLYSCQDLCSDSPLCLQFTWYSSQAVQLKLVCLLFSSPSTEYPCTGCISGPQSCPCDIPEPPVHGDWFCPPSSPLPTYPPSSPLPTCHLECDPGYVSSNSTVVTCSHGAWSSSPTCEPAVALITGSGYSPGSNTVEIYGEGLHQNLPHLPDDRSGHSLHYVNSLALLCGGQLRNSCLALTSTHHWAYHSTLISQRYSHSGVSLLGTLHLLGGSYSLDTTEQLAPPSGQWQQGWNLLERTKQACATKIHPQVLMMTGGDDHLWSVVSYNVTSGAAARLKNLNKGRYLHGCAYIKEQDFEGVVVAGGYYRGEVLSSSERYDISTGEWSAMGDLTTGRGGMKMVVLGDSVLAMGGYNFGALASVDRFNYTDRQWVAGENMLVERGWHAVAAVPVSKVAIDSK